MAITEDDIENLAETVVRSSTSGETSEEAVVYSAITSRRTIVRCPEKKVQTVNYDLAVGLPQRIGSTVNNDLFTGWKSIVWIRSFRGGALSRAGNVDTSVAARSHWKAREHK